MSGGVEGQCGVDSHIVIHHCRGKGSVEERSVERCEVCGEVWCVGRCVEWVGVRSGRCEEWRGVRCVERCGVWGGVWSG